MHHAALDGQHLAQQFEAGVDLLAAGLGGADDVGGMNRCSCSMGNSLALMENKRRDGARCSVTLRECSVAVPYQPRSANSFLMRLKTGDRRGRRVRALTMHARRPSLTGTSGRWKACLPPTSATCSDTARRLHLTAREKVRRARRCATAVARCSTTPPRTTAPMALRMALEAAQGLAPAPGDSRLLTDNLDPATVRLLGRL